MERPHLPKEQIVVVLTLGCGWIPPCLAPVSTKVKTKLRKELGEDFRRVIRQLTDQDWHAVVVAVAK